MIRCIIIDDEQPARELIKHYLASHPQVEVTGEYADGFTGLKGIMDQKPHLVFLDVQMPKLTGFEMIELLDELPLIIFTTAYDQYALKAFEMHAVDYLLKPFSQERFNEAIQRAMERMDQAGEGEKLRRTIEEVVKEGGILHRIAVRTGSNIRLIGTDEILYLEALDDYVRIHAADGKFTKKGTMKYYEEHLDPDLFVRVHRSTIVAIRQVKQIELYQKDSYLVTLKNGEKLPISRSGMQELKGKLMI
jgi:two-component system LytT family response regulator